MELGKSQRRSSTFNHCHSNLNKKIKINEESKSSERSVTRFEDLSNELFYEIFTYLDLYHVYQGFYTLNLRFHRLLIHSTVPLNVNLSSISQSTFADYHQRMIIPNQHRVRSLRVSHPFLADLIFSSVRVVSEFTRLKVLILDGFKSKCLPKFLHRLTSLPHLTSLVVKCLDVSTKVEELHGAIFRLPALKYCKVSIDLCLTVPVFPEITNSTSPIEHFVLDSICPLGQLEKIFPCLSQLRYLQMRSLYPSSKFPGNYLSHNPIQLTRVVLNFVSISLDEFQSISRSFFGQVEILHLRIAPNIDEQYLNAKWWEHLIVSSIPKLRIFNFHQTRNMNIDFDQIQLIYDSVIRAFSSSFWTERGWFFAYHYFLSWNYNENSVIFYSTNPYRGKKYIFHKQPSKTIDLHPKQRTIPSVNHLCVENAETVKSCGYHFPNTTKLTFNIRFKQNHPCLLTLLENVIPLNKLSELTIYSDDLCVEQFLKLLIASSHLQSLGFWGQPSVEINPLLTHPTETFRLAAENNRITNVAVQGPNLMENIQFLIRLCPRLQQLTFEVHKSEVETIVPSVLSKTKSDLRHLNLLCMEDVDCRYLRKVKNLIESKQLLDHYSIKRIDKTLYLWW